MYDSSNKHTRERIEQLAKELGVSEDEVVARAIDRLEAEVGSTNGRPMKTAYKILSEIGAIGCIEGPGDKSTNPGYFDDFGRA